MQLYQIIINNLLNVPLLCFIGGILFAFWGASKSPLFQKISPFFTFYILFAIGLKGGLSLWEHPQISSLFWITSLLLLWGFLQPFVCFWLLQLFTRLDTSTAAAVSACFGSVSVMTFITAGMFLDHLGIFYHKWVIVVLSLMEAPAIVSGIVLARSFEHTSSCTPFKSILKESILHPTLLFLLGGLTIGYFLPPYFSIAAQKVLIPFYPCLCAFLLIMGLRVGGNRHHFHLFSWHLHLFGIYMPLIGGLFGLFLSYLLQLDVGTGTMISVLSASASYIAVPAAMRTALPEAKEAVYLPLSLGITFPFNVLLGIPLYYYLASCLLPRAL